MLFGRVSLWFSGSLTMVSVLFDSVSLWFSDIKDQHSEASVNDLHSDFSVIHHPPFEGCNDRLTQQRLLNQKLGFFVRPALATSGSRQRTQSLVTDFPATKRIMNNMGLFTVDTITVFGVDVLKLSCRACRHLVKQKDSIKRLNLTPLDTVFRRFTTPFLTGSFLWL